MNDETMDEKNVQRLVDAQPQQSAETEQPAETDRPAETAQPAEPRLASNVLDCALVLEGGGYRGAFTAGVINALLTRGVYFDYVCGISAGSSNAVNYVSRDQHRVREAFLARGGKEPLGGLASIMRGKGYFNAEYLYEGALHDGTLNFDWRTFTANPARVEMQAFQRDTGRSVTFGKADMPTVDDMLLRVRASSTLPLAMHPKAIDGVTYLDGGLGEGGGIPLNLATRAGFDRFFIIATREAGYRKAEPTERERRLITRLGKGHPYVRNALLTRAERYNQTLVRIAELEAAGKALVVRPETMPVESGTLDWNRLMAVYDQGFLLAMRNMDAYAEFLFA